MIKGLDFIAIDFETANPDYSSICQIGLVFFENGEIVKEVSQLINPHTHFSGYNINIHGITADMVEGEPTFSEYFQQLHDFIDNKVVVHHQPFDYSAYCQACELHELTRSNTYWLNNAAVVRRTWEQFRTKGYGLKNVAKYLGIKFTHHDACEDARAAGLVFIEACKVTGKETKQWLKEVKNGRITTKRNYTSAQKLTGDILKPITDIGNTDSIFYGKKVVISGTFEKWPDRIELAKELKSLGADIDSSITGKTNYLITGEGAGPSKLKKMQKNIDEGKDAIIINEFILSVMLGRQS